MKIKNILVVNAVLILLLLAACGVLNPAAQAAAAPTAVVLPATGVQYYFVSDKLLLPTTQAQTEMYALNVDGDAQGQVDNKFGDLLTLLLSAAPSLELQSNLDQAVTAGQLVSLHVMKTDDPSADSNVSWSIFQGQMPQSPPIFDGADNLMIDSASPVNLPINGSLTGGHFSGGPGTSRIKIFLMDQTVDVNLVGIRLETDVSSAGCANGKMGGGVTVDEFRGTVLPAIAAGLNQIIKVNDAVSSTLLQAFDSDNNGSITTDELEGNPILMIAISPDLDLFDASGNFNPNQDGVKDSYSLGIGFTCVPAVFTAPEN